MTDTATTDTDAAAPDPIAEATGSDDPQVQRWVQSLATGADGRPGPQDAATLESWMETHRALLREAGNPALLEGLLGSQLAALHSVAMDRIGSTWSDARPEADRHRDLRLAIAMLRLTTRLRRERDRLAEYRAGRRRPRTGRGAAADATARDSAPGEPRAAA